MAKKKQLNEYRVDEILSNIDIGLSQHKVSEQENKTLDRKMKIEASEVNEKKKHFLGIYKIKSSQDEKVPNTERDVKNTCKEKKTCLSCKKSLLNILLHLNRSVSCQICYDMVDLKQKHSDEVKLKNKLRIGNFKKRKKKENPDLYKEQLKSQVNIARDKKNAVNPDLYKEQLKSKVNSAREKKKAENPDLYKEQLKSQVNIAREKKKAENPELYKEQLKSQVNIAREKKKAENPELYKKQLKSKVNIAR